MVNLNFSDGSDLRHTVFLATAKSMQDARGGRARARQFTRPLGRWNPQLSINIAVLILPLSFEE
jgi:hypothetical protein